MQNSHESFSIEKSYDDVALAAHSPGHIDEHQANPDDQNTRKAGAGRGNSRQGYSNADGTKYKPYFLARDTVPTRNATLLQTPINLRLNVLLHSHQDELSEALRCGIVALWGYRGWPRRVRGL
jgi:hypothetical protein